MSDPSPTDRYLAKFSGDVTKGTRNLRALEFALDIRKFEIDLYWKRAAYFWAFLALALGAYFAVLGSKDISEKGEPLLLIACLGSVFSVAWYLVNRASKFWQTNWEKHVDLLEEETLGPLYKTVLIQNDLRFCHLLDAYPFSVSKINQILSLFVSIVFLLLLAVTVHRHFRFAWPPEVFPSVLLVLTVGAVILLLFGGRTSFEDSAVVERTRSTKVQG